MLLQVRLQCSSDIHRATSPSYLHFQANTQVLQYFYTVHDWMQVVFPRPWSLCGISLKAHSQNLRQLLQGVKGASRQAQLQKKTERLENLLEVCLFAKLTEQSQFSLHTLCKGNCWKRLKKCISKWDRWHTKAQCPTSQEGYKQHLSHRPRCW